MNHVKQELNHYPRLCGVRQLMCGAVGRLLLPLPGADPAFSVGRTPLIRAVQLWSKLSSHQGRQSSSGSPMLGAETVLGGDHCRMTAGGSFAHTAAVFRAFRVGPVLVCFHVVAVEQISES